MNDLGQAEILVATGGTTTTTIYTGYSSRDEPPEDNYLLDGSVCVVRDAAGASAVPENEIARITAYDAGTYTWTHVALTTAPASGDTVMVCPSTFPWVQILQCANQSLSKLGYISLIDTSITTAAAQTEYTLPVVAKAMKPYRVQIQGITSDANDNRWQDIVDYEIVPAAAGSTGLLVLQRQPASGYNIKIWYRGLHPALTAYNSPISETIPPPLIRAMTIERALTWLVAKDRGSDEYLVKMLSDTRRDLKDIQDQWRVWEPDNVPLIIDFSRSGDVVDKVPDPV